MPIPRMCYQGSAGQSVCEPFKFLVLAIALWLGTKQHSVSHQDAAVEWPRDQLGSLQDCSFKGDLRPSVLQLCASAASLIPIKLVLLITSNAAALGFPMNTHSSLHDTCLTCHLLSFTLEWLHRPS